MTNVCQETEQQQDRPSGFLLFISARLSDFSLCPLVFPTFAFIYRTFSFYLLLDSFYPVKVGISLYLTLKTGFPA